MKQHLMGWGEVRKGSQIVETVLSASSCSLSVEKRKMSSEISAEKCVSAGTCVTELLYFIGTTDRYNRE